MNLLKSKFLQSSQTDRIFREQSTVHVFFYLLFNDTLTSKNIEAVNFRNSNKHCVYAFIPLTRDIFIAFKNF